MNCAWNFKDKRHSRDYCDCFIIDTAVSVGKMLAPYTRWSVVSFLTRHETMLATKTIGLREKFKMIRTQSRNDKAGSSLRRGRNILYVHLHHPVDPSFFVFPFSMDCTLVLLSSNTILRKHHVNLRLYPRQQVKHKDEHKRP